VKTKIALVSVIITLSFFLLRKSPISNSPEKNETSNQLIKKNQFEKSVLDSATNDRKFIEHAVKKNGKKNLINQLENFWDSNPELFIRLNMSLFDVNLNPNENDWKLLGLTKEDADSLSKEFKKIFAEIRNREINNFNIISQSDNKIQILLPNLSKTDSVKYLNQLENASSSVFGKRLANPMMQMFLNTHNALVGGIRGRDRIVTITSVTNDVAEKTKRKYEIRTQVMYEGAKSSDSLKDIESYSEDSGIELVEKIPDSWMHLFGNSE
jgi:hypothetical protein